MKAACRPVQETHFVELIDAGLDGQTARDLNRKPWAEGLCSLEDFLKAHRYLTLQMSKREPRDRDLFFRDEVMREFRRVVRTLVREDEVFVSDRKLIKLYRLLRTRAWIVHDVRFSRSTRSTTTPPLAVTRCAVPGMSRATRVIAAVDAGSDTLTVPAASAGTNASVRCSTARPARDRCTVGGGPASTTRG